VQKKTHKDQIISDLILAAITALTSSRRLKADGIATFASGIFLVP
jgi:hypothetical protein